LDFEEPSENFATENFIVRELLKHRSQLWALAYSITRDPHWSEDILQEVAIQLLKKRGDYETKRGFLPWALGFTRRQALKTLRKQARAEKCLEDRVWILVETEMESVPESSLRYLEKRKSALRDCLSQVSETHLAIFNMKYVEGLSAKEIAAKTHRTGIATHSLLQRLRTRLQDCITKRYRLAEP